jgi:hypothetical protein
LPVGSTFPGGGGGGGGGGGARDEGGVAETASVVAGEGTESTAA